MHVLLRNLEALRKLLEASPQVSFPEALQQACHRNVGPVQALAVFAAGPPHMGDIVASGARVAENADPVANVLAASVASSWYPSTLHAKVCQQRSPAATCGSDLRWDSRRSASSFTCSNLITSLLLPSFLACARAMVVAQGP